LLRSSASRHGSATCQLVNADRPFGRTVAAVAQRRFTGTLRLGSAAIGRRVIPPEIRRRRFLMSVANHSVAIGLAVIEPRPWIVGFDGKLYGSSTAGGDSGFGCNHFFHALSEGA
jgi:hypothetical protein